MVRSGPILGQRLQEPRGSTGSREIFVVTFTPAYSREMRGFVLVSIGVSVLVLSAPGCGSRTSTSSEGGVRVRGRKELRAGVRQRAGACRRRRSERRGHRTQHRSALRRPHVSHGARAVRARLRARVAGRAQNVWLSNANRMNFGLVVGCATMAPSTFCAFVLRCTR